MVSGQSDASTTHKYNFTVLQRANEPTPSLHVLLSALWDSEFAGHFRYYRIAVVLLADVGLELGTEGKSLQWLQDIMPQVWNYS